MTTAARRWTLVAAACAVIAGVAFTTCGREETPATVPPREREETRVARTDVAPPKPRRVRKAEASATADAAQDAPVGASDVGGFPTLDVEVVRADGAPAANAFVRAVASDAVDGDDAGGPHATSDSNGKCRLVLPQFGAFDVCADDAFLHATAIDVAVPRRDPLLLTLPAAADVVVSASEDARATLQRSRSTSFLQIERSSVAGGRVAARRNSIRRSGDIAAWPTDESDWRVQLGRDDEVRVVTSPDLAASPESLRAPGAVRITTTGLVSTNVRLRLPAPDPGGSADGWISVEIESVGAPREPAMHMTTRYSRGRTDGEPIWSDAYVVWIPSAGGTIRWRGRGVAPGERFVTPTKTTNGSEPTVVIDVVLDGTPLPAERPAGVGFTLGSDAATIDVRARNLGVSSAPTQWLFRSVASEHKKEIVDRDGLGHIKSYLPAWVVAVQGDRVSEPRHLTGPPNGEVELTLARGGYLVVDCPTSPPVALQPFTIRRKDGGPLVFMAVEELRLTIDAETKNRIGPLPPGDYVFVVRLASIDVAEVAATVRAGETTTLRLPILPVR